MKTLDLPIDQLLLPGYVVDALRSLKWVDSSDESITMHADDLIMMLYGTRGTSSYSDPRMNRYGSNTTCYQIFSPKLPLNHLFLGDGGSGVLEIDSTIIAKCLARNINPFDQKTTHANIAGVISTVVNLYTHYHFDHLHFGVPLTGLFHANSVKKRIIGGDDPETRFRNTFTRPEFPRNFGEIENAYDFLNIPDPRSCVIVLLPDGDYLHTNTSRIETALNAPKAQLEHNNRNYYIADCVIVRCYPAQHPDPCISFRFENYNENKELVNCITFMTDHDISDSDYDLRNNYFRKHVDGSDVFYIDGQYDNDSYVPGHGHGRVEVIGRAAASLDIGNVLIGHHAPGRLDSDVDRLLEKSRSAYQDSLGNDEPKSTQILGASDRMMIFIPDKNRGRQGMVFGRMETEPESSAHTLDGAGEQDSTPADEPPTRFRESYRLQDLTRQQ